MTLAATVSPTSGSVTPTGTVTFADSNGTLGDSPLTDGVATFSTSALPVGSDTITVSYSGDTTYAVNSATFSEQVNQAATNTTLNSSAASAVTNQCVTFTATVNPVTAGSVTPTGTVTFANGLQSLGTATLVPDPTSGVPTATFYTTFSSVSSPTITATYQGDANFTASASAGLTETISQVGTTATTTAATATPSTANAGQSVTFTATVGPTTGSGTPTGTVTFLDLATVLGTANLVADPNTGVPTATFSTSTLSVGSDEHITARYNGDTTFAASEENAIVTINAVGSATSNTALTASPTNSAVYGQSVTFTATVTGASTPTGTVTFTGGGASPTR